MLPYWHLKQGFEGIKPMTKLLTKVRPLLDNVPNKAVCGDVFLYTLYTLRDPDSFV